MSVDIETLSSSRLITGVIFLIWYIIILIVSYRGFFEIRSKFTRPSEFKVSDDTLEAVSIIRPIKGVDPS